MTFLAASIFLFLDLLFPAFYEERRDTFRRQWHKASIRRKKGLRGALTGRLLGSGWDVKKAVSLGVAPSKQQANNYVPDG